MKLLMIIACAAILAGCAGSGNSRVHPSAAVASPERLRDTPVLIDVRTPGEYASAHLPGAVNIPVDELSTRIAEVVPDKATPLMVHCQGGGRSSRAKAALDKMGYRNVRDLGSYAHAKAETEKLHLKAE